jgi:hypothetical protein
MASSGNFATLNMASSGNTGIWNSLSKIICRLC